jgi:chromosome segregation ATPase
LILEDSGKKTKTMTGQLSDVATQLAEIAEAIEILKTKTASAAPTPAAASGKPMTAAERKAALREEIQHNLANGDAEGDKAADAEAVATPKGEKVVNSAQAEQLIADIVDMKKRLIATQKVLENLQKQSETLQQQSQLVTDTLKSVETDVKALKPVAKVVSAPKAPVVKKVEEKEVAPKAEVKPIKPADDPEWRARWSQQMGKSDGFP